MSTVAGIQIFVGNIPWSSTEDDVRELFEQERFKVEDVRFIKDAETGRSKGYGFVTVPGHVDDGMIVATMNGRPLGGRTLVVERAKGTKGVTPRKRDRGR